MPSVDSTPTLKTDNTYQTQTISKPICTSICYNYMYYMYALHTILCMYYTYYTYVCTICTIRMYVLYVLYVCMYYMYNYVYVHRQMQSTVWVRPDHMMRLMSYATEQFAKDRSLYDASKLHTYIYRASCHGHNMLLNIS